MTATRPSPPPTTPRPAGVPAVIWDRYTDARLAVACPLCQAQPGSACVVVQPTRAGRRVEHRLGTLAQFAHMARCAVADRRPVQATMMSAVRANRVDPGDQLRGDQLRGLLETEARAVLQAGGSPVDLVTRMAQPGPYQLRLTVTQAAQIMGLVLRLQEAREALDQVLVDTTTAEATP